MMHRPCRTIALVALFLSLASGPALAQDFRLVNQAGVPRSVVSRMELSLTAYGALVAKAWSLSAPVFSDAGATAWPIYLTGQGAFSQAPCAGDMGCHTVSQGMPAAWVGWLGVTPGMSPASLRSYAMSEITLSHEFAEMLVDPWTDSTDASGMLVEVCDAMGLHAAADARGMELSDFAYPSWFQPGVPGPYDQLDLATSPLVEPATDAQPPTNPRALIGRVVATRIYQAHRANVRRSKLTR